MSQSFVQILNNYIFKKYSPNYSFEIKDKDICCVVFFANKFGKGHFVRHSKTRKSKMVCKRIARDNAIFDLLFKLNLPRRKHNKQTLDKYVFNLNKPSYFTDGKKTKVFAENSWAVGEDECLYKAKNKAAENLLKCLNII